MKKLLMTLMAALLPLLAFAEDWIEMYSQDGQTYYIYSAVEDEHNDHLAWIKTTYDTPESRKAAAEEREQDQLVFETRILIAFNLTWSKEKGKVVITYGEKGKVLSDTDIDNYTDWGYITPGSAVEAWRDAARMIYNKTNERSSKK